MVVPDGGGHPAAPHAAPHPSGARRGDRTGPGRPRLRRAHDHRRDARRTLRPAGARSGQRDPHLQHPRAGALCPWDEDAGRGGLPARSCPGAGGAGRCRLLRTGADRTVHVRRGRRRLLRDRDRGRPAPASMRSLPRYPHLRPEHVRWILVDAAPQIMPELGAKLGQEAMGLLERMASRSSCRRRGGGHRDHRAPVRRPYHALAHAGLDRRSRGQPAHRRPGPDDRAGQAGGHAGACRTRTGDTVALGDPAAVPDLAASRTRCARRPPAAQRRARRPHAT